MLQTANSIRGAIACWAGHISAALEKHYWRCAVVFSTLLLAGSVASGARRKMWVDELYTLHMARQASPVEIVKATLEKCDGAPPLYSMIAGAVLRVVPHEALAVRLPSSICYCGMFLCILAFCRRRLPALYAWIAALVACLAAFVYLTDGRGYGAVLFCVTAAMLAWQSAADGRHRTRALALLAFFLALMPALHYYAVFFLAPLFLAELVRWRRLGKPDVAVFLAAVAPLLLLLLHYPLIRATREFQSHYWSPASWDQILWFYTVYLLPPLIVCIPAIGLASLLATHGNGVARQRSLTAPEWAMMGALSVSPIVVVAVSMYTTHVFVGRYVLWAVPGIAVLLAALLSRVRRAGDVAGLSMALLLAAAILSLQVRSAFRQPTLREGQRVSRELSRLPGGAGPIVVANHHVFMELSYYSEPQVRERLVYPISRELDLRYLGVDTGAILISALSHRTRLQARPYDEVLAAHRRFLLAAVPADYLPRHLASAGYRVAPLTPGPDPVLYDVRAPGAD